MNRVIFYKEPIEPDYLQGGDVLAVFIDKPYKEGFDATVCCYTSMGQYSGMAPQYLNYCKLATKDEYRDLATELFCLGYVLEIINEPLEKPKSV